MKRNPKDNYFTTTDEMYIEDGDSAEQILFFIDRENRLVIRSLLEEDIKAVFLTPRLSASVKRKKMKMLYEDLPKKDSQYYYFCIEKIIGEEDKKCKDSIYGLPREIIGFVGIDEETTVTREISTEITAVLYEKNEQVAWCVDTMLEILQKKFECKKRTVGFLK